MGFGKEIDGAIEAEVQRRLEPLLKKSQNTEVELGKIKSAVSEKVDKVLQNGKEEILKSVDRQISDLKKAIDVAFETYWKPKVARKSYSEMRQWVINFLDVHSGDIFLSNEIKSQMPLNLIRDFEQNEIDSLIYSMLAKSNGEYSVIELDIDNDYVQMLLDNETISKRHIGIAKGRDRKIKFLTSAKAEPKREYFEDMSGIGKSKPDGRNVPVIDKAKDQMIEDDE